jgi:hypothetical protein
MYSPRLECLFVHVPRTGGTSVATGLARYFPDFKWKADTSLDPDHRLLAWQLRDYRLHPADVWSFAFVRNPWERFVSFYEFYHRWSQSATPEYLANTTDPLLQQAQQPFETWLREMHDPEPGHLLCPQGAWINGISYVGQFENLRKHFDTICMELGLDPPELPRLNARGTPYRPYQEYYSPALRQFVQQYEEQAIARFEYRFDP